MIGDKPEPASKLQKEPVRDPNTGEFVENPQKKYKGAVFAWEGHFKRTSEITDVHTKYKQKEKEVSFHSPPLLHICIYTAPPHPFLSPLSPFSSPLSPISSPISALHFPLSALILLMVCILIC